MTGRLHLLDLFSGAGGAARGYQLAGFHVTGVDIESQPHYCGDEFIQADALTFPLDGFDAIHASPPCQPWTAYRRRGAGVGDDYTDLIGPIRKRLREWGGPYVIENIPDAPLLDPIILCGSSFGLDVRRHRAFESNIPLLVPPCVHGWQTARFPQATNRANLRRTVEVGAWRCADLAPAAMGIDWMSNDELSEAIPPSFTQLIGEQLLSQIPGAAARPTMPGPTDGTSALLGFHAPAGPVAAAPVTSRGGGGDTGDGRICALGSLRLDLNHPRGQPMRLALIILAVLAADLLLAVGVGRFIRAGHRPVPPEPDGMPLLTTYATKPDQS